MYQVRAVQGELTHVVTAQLYIRQLPKHGLARLPGRLAKAGPPWAAPMAKRTTTWHTKGAASSGRQAPLFPTERAGHKTVCKCYMAGRTVHTHTRNTQHGPATATRWWQLQLRTSSYRYAPVLSGHVATSSGPGVLNHGCIRLHNETVCILTFSGTHIRYHFNMAAKATALAQPALLRCTGLHVAGHGPTERQHCPSLPQSTNPP